MDKNRKIDTDLHLHTNYTDGSLSPAEIIKYASKIGFTTIALTEHIDKYNASYDWYAYRDECLVDVPSGLNLLIGIEAKVLNSTGELNSPDSVISDADIVLGSVHGAGKVEWLLDSRCDIIAHPQITPDNLKLFLETNKILEINPKPQYAFESSILNELVKANRTFSFGSNTHIPEDLTEGIDYFKHIIDKYPDIKVIGYNLKMPDFKANRKS